MLGGEGFREMYSRQRQGAWKCNYLSVICNAVSFMLMHLKPLFSICRPILYYGLPREVVARD